MIIEYQLHGELTQTGESFSQRFAMILTVRDGQIVHSRDYTNPITGARLLGKLPARPTRPWPDQPGSDRTEPNTRIRFEVALAR